MRSVRLGDFEFLVRPGWTVERVAAEPLIKWPIVADWDLDGDLVVVESAGVSRPIVEHNAQRLHRIVRLKDTDGDGIADDNGWVSLLTDAGYSVTRYDQTFRCQDFVILLKKYVME